VTRRRIYLETMRDLIPRLERKVILDEKARGVLPLLSIDGAAKEVKP
jgi:modulator of FtsH protease HflK